MDYRIWVVFVIALYRSIVLSFFVAEETLDMRFLTYIMYTLTTTFWWFVLMLSGDTDKLAFALLMLLPIVFNASLFVGVAIVVIVQLNDWIFMHTTVFYGGPRLVGAVHTGDWLLHQLPVIEVFVLMLMYISNINACYTTLKSEFFTKLGSAIYYAYVVASGALVVGMYFATEDFQRNYPVDHALGSAALQVILSLLMSLLIGGFFLLLFRLTRYDVRNRRIAPK
jgi:hypothetical protein